MESEYLTDVDLEDLHWLLENPVIYQRPILVDLIQKVIRIAISQREQSCGQQSS